MSQPSRSVLEAFNLHGTPTPLEGGRGLCFQVNDTVLKPSEDYEESQFIAEVINKLHSIRPPTTYRVPLPYPAVFDKTVYVQDGWTAWSLLPGGHAHGIDRYPLVFELARRFHSDLALLSLARPSFLDRLSDRFHESDRLAWDEKSISSVPSLNRHVLSLIQQPLDELNGLKRPLQITPPSQIIHADLAGNILYADLPGIIDMTFFWRPAAYGEALIAADALIWSALGRELVVDLYGGLDETRIQLLVRALLYRCVAFAIDSDMRFIDAFLPKADFRGAAEIVRGVMEEMSRATGRSRQSSWDRDK
ncbi:unnamed protein product [Clonostachys rosea f. rosea IK726]|uniref:Uncharacterized protein n=1 Tax=Clonostachys rosea f. rosea IK726 TaxID=1349383 RepID=A0ACA9U7S8_BIOOC|nr:unnamed protein product [Clonostachys rosea f. rosea IK726]